MLPPPQPDFGAHVEPVVGEEVAHAEAADPMRGEAGPADTVPERGAEEAGDGAPASSRGPMLPALAVVHLEGGRIAHHATKEAFEAVCSNKLHRGCNLSRTAKGRRQKGSERLVAGRPVDLLARWLQDHNTVDTKAAHKDLGRLVSYSLEERRACRRRVAAAHGGEALLSMEREQHDGEASEPEDLGPYIR